MLFSWMTDNQSCKWSEGLNFVQFSKNNAYHSGINRSPYEALFGHRARAGLHNLNSTPSKLSSSEERLVEDEPEPIDSASTLSPTDPIHCQLCRKPMLGTESPNARDACLAVNETNERTVEQMSSETSEENENAIRLEFPRSSSW